MPLKFYGEVESLVSIRERLYDLVVRLSSTDPEASHLANDLYEDMRNVVFQIDTTGV